MQDAVHHTVARLCLHAAVRVVGGSAHLLDQLSGAWAGEQVMHFEMVGLLQRGSTM